MLLPRVGCGGLGPTLEVGRFLLVNHIICPYSSVLKHAAGSILGSILIPTALHGTREGAALDPPP